MASLNEIAYNIRNIARGGYASDDELISIRKIKHWVSYHRAQLLMNYTSNGKFIHPQTFQLYTSELVKNTTPVKNDHHRPFSKTTKFQTFISICREVTKLYITSTGKAVFDHVTPFNPLYFPKTSFSDIVSNVILNQR